MPGSRARSLLPGDLFHLQFLHDARLSPDGSRIVHVTSRTEREQGSESFELSWMDLATGTRHKLPFAGQASSPRWSPDGSRMAFIGTLEGAQHLYVCDADGGNIRALSSGNGRVQGPPSWSPDGKRVAYSEVVAATRTAGFHRVTKRLFRAEGLGIVDELTSTLHVSDVGAPVTRHIETGVPIAMRPAFSPCGNKILFLGAREASGYPPLNLGLYVFDLRTQACSEVLGKDWYVAHAQWSHDGTRIVFAGDRSSPLTIPDAGLWVVDSDGSNPVCRTEGVVGQVGLHVHHDMPTWSTLQNRYFEVANEQAAYVTVTRSGRAEIHRVMLDGPVACEPVVTGDRHCAILDTSNASGQLLYGATDFHSPWELHLADASGQNERSLSTLNNAMLERWPKLRVEHLAFASQDGLPLEAWFLSRADLDRPLPTVLFIHGGPELCVGHAFRFDFHLLAANGYAVLAVNFRGSAGYGQPFRLALKGDWGARGFPDYMAAIDTAISLGLADPKRLGVWGPSHGGFATCWVVTHTNRFCAAAAESSAVNLSTLYYLSDAPDIFVKEFGGRPNELPELYRKRSPLTYASRCRTPTLMIHGEADLRCSIAEAEQFYRALHEAGCETEMVRIPDMTHMGDSDGPLHVREAQNEALLEWFERHL